MSAILYTEIIELITQAGSLAQKIGIPNLYQPGLVKEIIVANLLGHKICPQKHYHFEP
jgi:hypothetical protein